MTDCSETIATNPHLLRTDIVPTVLIVDDSAKDRGLAGGLLAKDDNEVTYATNGREALSMVESDCPDIVVSDLQMPEMNGLELVEAMRQEFPSIPVVLMTARGSEEIASEALRKGAAGYVPKITLGQNLRSTVRRLVADTEADKLHSRLMHSLVVEECTFWLRNDPELFDPLVSHIQESLRCLPLGDEAERLRVSVGLRQALWIAHLHGNLEIPISLEFEDHDIQQLLTTRSSEEPYADRVIEVKTAISRTEAMLTVSHEGPGIDVGQLPDNLDEEAADRSWLSRFVLITSVMDDVTYTEGGQVLQMLKKAIDQVEEIEIG